MSSLLILVPAVETADKIQRRICSPANTFQVEYEFAFITRFLPLNYTVLGLVIPFPLNLTLDWPSIRLL